MRWPRQLLGCAKLGATFAIGNTTEFAAEYAEENVHADQVTEIIIGAAIKVHRELGPGLLESAYETCLAYELVRSNLRVEQQKQLPVVYAGVKMNAGYRIDLFVEDCVLVELKTVDQFDAVHIAQVLTYLKLSGCQVGLLLNFNVVLMKDGIRRIVRNYPDLPRRPQRPRRLS